jgi:hypothetical protein
LPIEFEIALWQARERRPKIRHGPNRKRKSPVVELSTPILPDNPKNKS